MFVSCGPESKVCIAPSSLGNEWLVGVCDPDLHACRSSHNDSGVVFVDVPGGVCSTYGERATVT